MHFPALSLFFLQSFAGVLSMFHVVPRVDQMHGLVFHALSRAPRRGAMRKIPKVKGEKNMRKILAIAVLFALATLFTTPVFASSVHLKGDHSKPAFTDNGLTLTGSGELAGLGV